SRSTWSKWGRARVSKCRRLDEAPGFTVMSEQRFHLAAEVLIPGTRLPDEFASPAFFHLQSSVKDLFDLSPTLRLHRASLRSVPAAARPWLTANPALQFRVKPSIPRRFPPRSGRQRTASRPPGFCAHPLSPADSEHHL